MTWTKYHEQDDIESYLDYLANTYDFVELGVSYEGRPMRVVKVQYLFRVSFCNCPRLQLKLE